MNVIKRLEMSLWCLQELVGECSASDSLQTLTFSDAAAAETKLTSLVHSANPNCEYFTAKIWTHNIYTCSPLQLPTSKISVVFLQETVQ